MTIQQVIDKIIAYHPDLGERAATTCDTVKYGDTSGECTGVATAIYPSPDVIRAGHEAGCNLLLVHEPSFYTHMDPLDWLKENSVAQKKMALLDEYGMVIFRDHDRIHTHIPDGIFYGVLHELGWLSYADQDINQPRDRTNPVFMTLTLPDIPAAEVVALIKEKLGLQSLRFTGNPGTIVHKAAFAGHLFPGAEKLIEFIDREKIDLLIPGEIIDWEVPCYFKDAGQMGMNKACLHLGHFNMEELGMKYAVNWLKPMVGDIPVVYCPNEDMYRYF